MYRVLQCHLLQCSSVGWTACRNGSRDGHAPEGKNMNTTYMTYMYILMMRDFTTSYSLVHAQSSFMQKHGTPPTQISF